MQQTRWQKIEHIFNEAVALSPEEREEFVARRCGSDDELCREILALLAADAQNPDFLNEPVLEDGLRLMDHEFADLLGEQEFVRYKLLKLLGRGGMGAVFLARDTMLGRDVALKILPQRFADAGGSVERFRQEARAASAVSHPNVAHIYEFGEANGRYFLAMEYVSGKTLRELLKDGEVTPARALEIVRQTAQAIEKMHQSGIIHRDIKPENIIIDDGGQVKILDFGLAKFSPEKRANSLETSMETLPGVVLGTSAYMSPEQVRGQQTDERTDVWSLAVVFFEMIFGARPFTGETASDIRAAILRDELPLEGLPAGLKKLLSKAFEKNPERRFQSVGEFADELERLEKSNLKANLTRILKPAPAPPYSGLTLLVGALLAIAAAATIAYFIWTRGNASPISSLTAAKRLTNSGKVKYTTLTPDGELFAYSLEELGGRSIYLVRRNPQTGEYDAPPQTLMAANKNIVSQLAFAPDKKFLYFKMRELDKSVGSLYRLPVAAATRQQQPEKILDDIQGAPTFSPDGGKIAFLRMSLDNSHETLLVADAETGGGERALYVRSRPAFIPDTAQPAWSPDGRTILCAGGVYEDDAESYTVYAVDAESGAARAVLTDFWAEIWATAWTNDGGGFVFAGHKEKLADNNQLWSATYPSGEVRRLTDDYNDYFTITAAAAAKNSGETDLVSIILQRRAQIYRAEVNRPEASAVLLTPEGDYGYGISVASDGRVFYGSTKSGNPDVWTMNRDGSDARQLTFDPKLDSQPFVTAGGEYVVFGSYRSGAEALWRMKPDGSEQKLLASNIIRDSLAVSPDGRDVYYRSNAKGAEAIFRVSIGGGEPEKFSEGNYKSLAVSPDGRLLAATLEDEADEKPRLAVLSISAPAQKPQIYPLANGALPFEKIRFTPDGRSVAYIAVQNGIGNLWRQKLDQTAPEPLTDFKTDALYSFDFSPDGKEIFCARGELNGYAVRFTLTSK